MLHLLFKYLFSSCESGITAARHVTPTEVYMLEFLTGLNRCLTDFCCFFKSWTQNSYSGASFQVLFYLLTMSFPLVICYYCVA